MLFRSPIDLVRPDTGFKFATEQAFEATVKRANGVGVEDARLDHESIAPESLDIARRQFDRTHQRSPLVSPTDMVNSQGKANQHQAQQ